MPFLYFIPSSATDITASEIDRLGMSYAIDKPRNAGCTGPGSQRGFVMGRSPEVMVGYHPDKQTWVEAPKLGEDKAPYWVGWEELPTPDELEREEMIEGVWITLENGSRWKVPKLLQWDINPSNKEDANPILWRHTLPRCIGINDSGHPTMGDLVPKYKDLFDFGMRVFTKIAGGVADIDDADFISFAAACLTMNYRVSLLELSTRVMSGLTVDDSVKIVHSAVDFDGYQDALGNAAGRPERPTTDMDSGSEQSTPDSETVTDLQSAN